VKPLVVFFFHILTQPSSPELARHVPNRFHDSREICPNRESILNICSIFGSLKKAYSELKMSLTITFHTAIVSLLQDAIMWNDLPIRGAQATSLIEDRWPFANLFEYSVNPVFSSFL
jgi:hypothetical protein